MRKGLLPSVEGDSRHGEGGDESMNLYQCPKCGREAGIADFIKKVTVICRCGSKMVKVATGAANSKGYMQLRLFG